MAQKPLEIFESVQDAFCLESRGLTAMSVEHRHKWIEAQMSTIIYHHAQFRSKMSLELNLKLQGLGGGETRGDGAGRQTS